VVGLEIKAHVEGNMRQKEHPEMKYTQ
jgi:hypothetical protein